MLERRKKIVKIINDKNVMSFADLKLHFPDIADITLRRDLSVLSQENRIIRVHGGVKSIKFQVGTDGELSYRSVINQNAKQAIAQKAAEYIHPNTTIFIDSGSTCLELCKIFPDIPVLIFTSGLNCAMELCKRKHVKLYTLGGMVNKDTMALSGSTALSTLEHLHFNIAFMGTLGCADGKYFSIGSEESAFLKREVIQRAAHSFMLIDSSKFGVTETFRFCETNELHTIITDDRISDDLLKKLSSSGKTAVIAAPSNAG